MKISGHIHEISHSYFLAKYRGKKIINKDDVDDLTANVYIAFAEQYQKIESIENWLRRVLFLTFVRFYKQNNLKKTTQLRESITADDTFTSTDNLHDVNAIVKLMDTLSDERQEILRLRFWGDLKFNEIAEKLNKNEAAVKKMFYRSIEEIKNKLK